MQARKISLKISYGGVLNYISSEKSLSYEDIIDIVIEKFGIKKENKGLLEFCDAEGFTFDKETFEYLIKIFPTCQRILYLRPNYNKVTNNSAMSIEEEIFFSPYKFSARIYGAPLIRQNCFIGVYPDEKNLARYKPYNRRKRLMREKFKAIRV